MEKWRPVDFLFAAHEALLLFLAPLVPLAVVAFATALPLLQPPCRQFFSIKWGLGLQMVAVHPVVVARPEVVRVVLAVWLVE